MLGDDARRHLKHKTADAVANGHVMRFHSVQDALARRGVGNVLSTRQCRAERAGLGGMFALGFEEERVVSPDIAAAGRTERLVDL